MSFLQFLLDPVAIWLSRNAEGSPLRPQDAIDVDFSGHDPTSIGRDAVVLGESLRDKVFACHDRLDVRRTGNRWPPEPQAFQFPRNPTHPTQMLQDQGIVPDLE